MPFSENDQKTVAAFLGSIERQMPAYDNGSFAYLAVKRDGGFTLFRGATHLRTPAQLPLVHFASPSVRAGHFRLAEAALDLTKLIAAISSGRIPTPDGDLYFPPPDESRGGYNVWHSPFHPAGLQSNRRISVLGMRSADTFPHDRMAELDWELKAGAIPFDGLSELLSFYSLGTLQNFTNGIEIFAPPVVEIEPASRINGTEAIVEVRLADGLETPSCAVSYRALSRGQVIARARVEGGDFRWERDDSGWRGVKKIDFAEPTALQCTASYRHVGQHSAVIADSATAQNLRRSAYEAVDAGLAKLREIVARESDSGNSRDARDFEAAISWVFWMIGFAGVHLGATHGTQKACDLLAATPSGQIAVIECTLGVLKADKLALLHDRTQDVRRALEAAGNRETRVLAIAVTAQPLADVEADLDTATKRQIYVIAREQLDTLIGDTSTPPDADDFFANAEQSLKLAFSRSDPASPLGFSELL